MAVRDQLKIISQFGSDPGWYDHAFGESIFVLAKRIRSEQITLALDLDERAEKIRADINLSAQGKSNQLANLGIRARENAKNLKIELGPVEEAHQAAITKARTKGKSTEENIADLFLRTEIRGLLKEQIGGDEVQVKIAYYDALKRGDFATADAIETLPDLWPGRPSNDDLEAWQADRLEIEEPQLSHEVALLSEALNDTGNAFEQIEADIQRISGIEVEDNVAAILAAE
jgi:hypothetical protein